MASRPQERIDQGRPASFGPASFGPVSFGLADLPVPLVYTTYRIIRDCNLEFASLFGFSRAELIDRSFAILYPNVSDFIRTGHMWQAHMLGGQVYYDERVMTRQDGTRFWCRVNGRSHHATEPFAQAVYCFEPLSRPVKLRHPSLTDRQRQIIALVVQGKTNTAIGEELGLSRRTVESHRARLMQAIGLRNSAELVAWFTSSGEGAF